MVIKRCSWVGGSPLEQSYHDHEWGVPLHDDQRLFEFLILEGAQAGLSWITILKKRQAYRQAYDNFDAHKIAQYDETKCSELMQNPGIVRNRLKISASINNARVFLQLQDEFTSFDNYIWQFCDGRIIQNTWSTAAETPTSNAHSTAMSKDLKRRGCKFVGPTICYAFMQATGMINDHTTDCFRHAELHH